MMKIFYKLLFFAALLIPLFSQTGTTPGLTTITRITDSCIEVNISQFGEEFQRKLSLLEVYDVYETVETVDRVPVYRNYIDSLYLKEILPGMLLLDYLWDGEKKLLKEGFFLCPTGQIFSSAHEEIRGIISSGKNSKSDRRLRPFKGNGIDLFILGGLSVSSSMDDYYSTSEGSAYDNSVFPGVELEAVLHLFDWFGLKTLIVTGPELGLGYVALNLETFYKIQFKSGLLLYGYVGAGYNQFLSGGNLSTTGGNVDMGLGGAGFPGTGKLYHNLTIDIFCRVNMEQFTNNFYTLGIKAGFRI